MNSLSKQVAALSLGLLAAATPLAAQAQFLVGGGLGLPMGDFGDAAKTGFHALAGVSFAPPTMPVGFQVDGNFAQFGTETDNLNDRMMFATGNVVYKFKVAEATRLRPYLIGGVGVYNQKATGDAAPTDAASVTDFGINAGAGFNVSAGAASLFVEGRFHDIFTDGSSTQFVPLTVGLRFGGK